MKGQGGGEGYGEGEGDLAGLDAGDVEDARGPRGDN